MAVVGAPAVVAQSLTMGISLVAIESSVVEAAVSIVTETKVAVEDEADSAVEAAEGDSIVIETKLAAIETLAEEIEVDLAVVGDEVDSIVAEEIEVGSIEAEVEAAEEALTEEGVVVASITTSLNDLSSLERTRVVSRCTPIRTKITKSTTSRDRSRTNHTISFKRSHSRRMMITQQCKRIRISSN